MYISDDIKFIPAFGNNKFRLEWLEKIGAEHGKIASLIHPKSYVSPKAVIEEGVVMVCVNIETGK